MLETSNDSEFQELSAVRTRIQIPEAALLVILKCRRDSGPERLHLGLRELNLIIVRVKKMTIMKPWHSKHPFGNCGLHELGEILNSLYGFRARHRETRVKLPCSFIIHNSLFIAFQVLVNNGSVAVEVRVIRARFSLVVSGQGPLEVFGVSRDVKEEFNVRCAKTDFHAIHVSPLNSRGKYYKITHAMIFHH